MKNCFRFLLLLLFSAGAAVFARDAALVAHWDFNTVKNDLVPDKSGNNLNGTARNTQWKQENGNGYLYFNGKNAFVQIKHDPKLNIKGDLTLCAKVRPYPVPKPFLHVILGKNGDPWNKGNSYALYFTQNSRFGFRTVQSQEKNAFSETYTEPMEPGKWYELAAVRKKGTLTIYIDGGMVSRKPCKGDTMESTLDLFIGGSGGSRTFWGDIDDVRIYSRALHESEIGSNQQVNVQNLPPIPAFHPEKKKFSFLLLGDIHYNQLANFARQHTIKQIARQIKRDDLPVDFVLHTGDLIQAHPVVSDKLHSYDQAKAEWEFALADLKKNFSCPVFMTPGNHDLMGGTRDDVQKNIREIYLPWQSKEVGKKLNNTYYTVRFGNAVFVFTGYSRDRANSKYIRSAFARKGKDGVEHVFFAGHNILRPLSTVLFDDQSMRRMLEDLPETISGYFCGHVHLNELLVYSGKRDIVQVISIPFGKSPNPLLPLQSERTPLIPQKELKFGRTLPPLNSFWIFTVEGKQVSADFYLLGKKEPYWQMKYTVENDAVRFTETKAPAGAEETVITREMLADAVSAKLHFFHYTPTAEKISVSFNGKEAGFLKVNCKNFLKFFTDHTLDIPVSSLKQENTVEFINPAKADFAVRDIYLELQLSDKRIIRSKVSSKVILSGEKIAGKYRLPAGVCQIGTPYKTVIKLDKGLGIK